MPARTGQSPPARQLATPEPRVTLPAIRRARDAPLPPLVEPAHAYPPLCAGSAVRGGAGWLRRTGFSVVSVSQHEFAGIPAEIRRARCSWIGWANVLVVRAPAGPGSPKAGVNYA